MKVIVCGSRDWSDPAPILTVLSSLRHEDVIVIHGAARGADQMAGQVARVVGLDVQEFPADWRGQGKAAGHIRNRLMLDEKPDVVWAFKDGFDWTFSRGGTENMVRIAQEAGVPAYVVGSAGSRSPVGASTEEGPAT